MGGSIPLNKKPFFACTAILLIISLFWPGRGSSAENIRKVALFPFDINSTTPDGGADLQELVYRGIAAELLKSKIIRLVEQEQITAAAGRKRLNDALAIETGRQTGAAYTVTGSVTEFGERISVDVRLIDVGEGKLLPGVFVQGRGRENLSAILTQLRMDILSRITAEQRIVRVEFKGNRKIEGSAINQGLKSTVGNIFIDADLSNDIKAIYKMGYFDDVTAEVADSPDGKVITFIVEEKPLIAEILTRGNKAVKKDDIESVMTVRTRQTSNPEKLMPICKRSRPFMTARGSTMPKSVMISRRRASGTSASSSASSKMRNSSSEISPLRAIGPSRQKS
jgi:outer membrane protein insertion porin family